MKVLAHLSDLHFGRVDPAVLEPLRRRVEALRPDLVVVSGDLTQRARKEQFAEAKALLAEGLARAKALADGQAPWTTKSGLVVRGYRSRIDGSVQPYGLVVPETWTGGDKRPRRLDVFNHGRGENLTELSFMSERSKKPRTSTHKVSDAVASCSSSSSRP